MKPARVGCQVVGLLLLLGLAWFMSVYRCRRGAALDGADGCSPLTSFSQHPCAATRPAARGALVLFAAAERERMGFKRFVGVEKDDILIGPYG